MPCTPSFPTACRSITRRPAGRPPRRGSSRPEPPGHRPRPARGRYRRPVVHPGAGPAGSCPRSPLPRVTVAVAEAGIRAACLPAGPVAAAGLECVLVRGAGREASISAIRSRFRDAAVGARDSTPTPDPTSWLTACDRFSGCARLYSPFAAVARLATPARRTSARELLAVTCHRQPGQAHRRPPIPRRVRVCRAPVLLICRPSRWLPPRLGGRPAPVVRASAPQAPAVNRAAVGQRRGRTERPRDRDGHLQDVPPGSRRLAGWPAPVGGELDPDPTAAEFVVPASAGPDGLQYVARCRPAASSEEFVYRLVLRSACAISKESADRLIAGQAGPCVTFRSRFHDGPDPSAAPCLRPVGPAHAVSPLGLRPAHWSASLCGSVARSRGACQSCTSLYNRATESCKGGAPLPRAKLGIFLRVFPDKARVRTGPRCRRHSGCFSTPTRPGLAPATPDGPRGPSAG